MQFPTAEKNKVNPTFVDGLQEAANKEAERLQELRNKQGSKNSNNSPATTTMPANTTPGSQPAATTSPAQQQQDNSSTPPSTTAPADTSLSTDQEQQQKRQQLADAFNKEFGTNFTPDQIAERLKNDGAGSSENNQPQTFDVTDDELVDAWVKLGKTKDELNQAREVINNKDDLQLVILEHGAELRAIDPKITDEQIEAIVKEKYFIADEGIYDHPQIAYGKLSLQKEATRIRETQASALEGVTEGVKRVKKTLATQKLYEAEVDRNLSTMPKKVTINIGKIGAKELGSFEMDIDDATVNNIREIMKDPKKFGAKFTNPATGGIDLNKLREILVQIELSTHINKSLANYYHSQGLDQGLATANSKPDLNNLGGSNTGDGGQSKEAVAKEVQDHNAAQINKHVGRGQR